MPFSLRSFQFAVVPLLLLYLLGCGEKTVIGTNSNKLEESQRCIDCHGAVSKVTGNIIADEWLRSSHNTKNGAGCADCHEPHQSHPSAGDCNRCHGGSPVTGVDVIVNADAAGKCSKCHTKNGGFKTSQSAHFNNLTSVGYPASYVSSMYGKNCRACHNPHDTSSAKTNLQQWALTKGKVTANAFSELDFKNFKSGGSYVCIRCHTATGFINFIKGSATAFPVATWAVAGDTTKEVMACNVCHETYDYKKSARKVGAFTAPYGGSAANPGGIALNFPDVGQSNLCVPCHAGRENGESMILGTPQFNNASMKNPHYLAAAAVFYGNGGYQYYNSASQTPYFAQAYTTKYGVVVDGTVVKAAAATAYVPAISIGDSLVGNKAPWNHGKLGMNNFVAVEPAGIGLGDNTDPTGKIWDTGSRGQCITCHLGPKSTHTYSAFETRKATWGTNSTGAIGCYGCHNGEDMEEVATKSEKILYDRAMAFFQYELSRVGLFYNDGFYTSPYVTGYTEAGLCSNNLSVKNWLLGGKSTFTWNSSAKTCDSAVDTLNPGITGSGPGVMGAAMNFRLLKSENGAHVHNRTYMKQLIFDSIQYIQTGSVSFSNRNIAVGSQVDANKLISFQNYSTYLQAQPDKIINTAESAAQRTNAGVPGSGVNGQPVSISQLKRYLTRYNTSGPANAMFTRP
jgi:hypothetical protein